MEWGKVLRGAILEDDAPVTPVQPAPVVPVPLTTGIVETPQPADVAQAVEASLNFVCDNNPTLKKLLATQRTFAEDVKDDALCMRLVLKSLAAQDVTPANLRNALQAGMEQVRQDAARSAKEIDARLQKIEELRLAIVNIDKQIAGLQTQRQTNVDGTAAHASAIDKIRAQSTAVTATVTAHLQEILDKIVG